MSSSNHSSASSTRSRRRLSSTKSDLNKFEVEGLKFILHETVSKLIIANGGEKASHLHPSETKLPMKIRYRESREKLFHEETLEPIHEAMERMIFVKLGNDVSRLRKILGQTIDDLDQTGDFRTLKIFIDTEIRLEAEERNLIEANYRCDKWYRFLEKKFDEDTKMYKGKVKEIDDIISEVEGELNDLKVENKIKLQLLHDWEKTRYGQLKFITDNKEKMLDATTENYKKEVTRELRLKHEIETFLESQIEYYEDLNRQWNEKYEKEVNELDEQINATKDEMIALKLKFDNLVNEHELRELEIQEYLEERKIKENELMEIERRHEATVKIQSWWKGILVRRALRKKMKPAKKKAKKKDKEKE